MYCSQLRVVVGALLRAIEYSDAVSHIVKVMVPSLLSVMAVYFGAVNRTHQPKLQFPGPVGVQKGKPWAAARPRRPNATIASFENNIVLLILAVVLMVLVRSRRKRLLYGVN